MYRGMDRLPRDNVVHRMTAADVPAVAAIDAVSFSSTTADHDSLPTSEERFRDELRRPWSHGWVVRDEREMAIGFLLTWVVADEMHVLTLATHPRERRRGIGASLVATAIAFARSGMLSQMLLEVRRSNQGAIRLYRAAGFFVRHVRRRYYPDDEDAVEMAIILDPRTGEVLSRVDEARVDA
jgi:[ribosomal protein S18]-alanine N-acetyltransferase